jgi:hypothetical protein
VWLSHSGGGVLMKQVAPWQANTPPRVTRPQIRNIQVTRGIKPRSERTYFLTPEQASALAPTQGRFRIIDHGDGTLSVATPSGRGNRWGVAASQRRVGPVATAPGLHPLELWSGAWEKFPGYVPA